MDIKDLNSFVCLYEAGYPLEGISGSAAAVPLTEELSWPVSLILSKKQTLSSNGEEFCRFLIREFQIPNQQLPEFLQN